MSYASNTQYPKESVELVGVEVTSAGARVLTGVALGLLPDGDERDTIVWETPTQIGQRWGLLLNGTRTAGKYEVWAKVTTTDEVAWISGGVITLY